MAKYKGNNLSLVFTQGVLTEEVNLEATSVVLANEEGDDDEVTFAELASGANVQWYFEITATSDYAAATWWTFCWEKAGQTATFVFKPYGNASASASQPHFTGSVTMGAKPGVGGAAGETWTFEKRMDLVGEPTRVIA